MYVYVVEVESGSSVHDGAMVFDSVWSSEELAQKYCEKFKTSGAFDIPWVFSITKCIIDE